MPAKLLSGREAREALMPALAARVRALAHQPMLAIIQVGDRPDSVSYIRAKKSFAEKIGAAVRHISLPENVTQERLTAAIEECNEDPVIHGIIVQLPLPLSLDRDAAIETIDPAKDADGLTSFNVKRWTEGREDAVLPATARGVQELLAHYRIDLFEKKVAVVGRSMLVGKPIAAMCQKENAIVTVLHSKTPDVAAETSKADILIVAAGRPRLIVAAYVHSGQIVVDVGINKVGGARVEKLEDEPEGEVDGKQAELVGDVDFEAVSAAIGDAGAITPVPGGVGPMTVLGLFENLADLCENHII